ncbi:MAG: FG-GAP repeat protein [Verrucomicrobiota bacterium]
MNEILEKNWKVISVENSPVAISDEPVVSKLSIQKADTIQELTEGSNQSPTRIHGSLLTMSEEAEELNRTEQESLWSAFSEARRTIYPLTERQLELPENTGAHFFAQNPGQEITARFMDDGVQFGSGYAGREWAGKLSLAGSQPHEIRHEGTVLEYHYDGIIEWIENRPEGYRQGWVLADRPLDSNHEHIRLQLSVVGLDVEPLASREQGSSDLQFVNEVGEAVLSYTGLIAWDANGQILESSMQPTEEGLKILVADAGATYPITIDPLVASLEEKLGPEVTGDGSRNDHLGLSLSIWGDTALVGSVWDDDNGVDSGSAYVFVRSGAIWSLEQKLRADDGEANDRFGFSVSISGDTALIGARDDDNRGINSGSAYIFVRDGMSWSQQQKITADDRRAFDQFGYSVSISGDTALIGAYLDDDEGEDSGSAYIFERSGTTWSQEQKLTADDGAPGDTFGRSVSISGDTALIGTDQDDDGGSASGSAYVFVRDGASWSQQQKLTADDGAAGDRFGYSVSISGDTVLIGAYLDNDNGEDSGSAYVFVRDGMSWSEQQKLIADDGAAEDQFGLSVSVSEDIALIGAPRDDDMGSMSGNAYVFVRSGTSWSEEQKLTADDNAAGDRFGSAVSVFEDTALIGAPRDDDGHSDAGSASIFVRTGADWTQQQKLTAGDGAAEDRFGYSVSIDGDTALIGVAGDNDMGTGSGSAYVFVRSGTTWTQESKLTSDDSAAGDRFGASVSISGNTALIGADLDDDIVDASGSAYVFVRTGTVWTQEQKLTADDDAASGDFFGFSVSVSADTALIGAPEDDDDGSRSGSVYVFLRSGTSWSEQQKLTAGDADNGDFFGESVSIDGDIALIGAPGNNNDDDDEERDFGSAYIFVRNGTSWTQEQRILADNGESSDNFGRSVSLSGNTALIGATGGNGLSDGTGSAYVFVRDGTNWNLLQELIASDGARGDGFGRSVSISGNLAVIGADFESGDADEFFGSAYVFRRNGVNWSQEQKLTADNRAPRDFFGRSVSISGDTVLIGVDQAEGLNASGFTSVDQGAVYVFRVVEDFDQGSEAWQIANGFDPDVPNDEATLDSDGDGDLDMLEIFQGTDRNDSSERFGFQDTGHDGSDLLATFRRSTTQTSVNAQRRWSTDLINWYTTGQTDGNITVNLTETVVGSDTGFQLIEIKANVTGGITEKLFISLSLSPNE